MDPRMGNAPALAEIARAARILAVRSRREAAGLLVGAWRSAFRGGGVEFEESRPYVPGDDVRAIDWNATARTDTPWVKRFREERSCTVLLALDASASMAFGTTGRSKAQVAAHAAALLAASAAQAGDPVGLLVFGDGVQREIPPGRGDAHTWRVVRAAAESAETPRGTTDLGVVAEWVRAHARRRSGAAAARGARPPPRSGGRDRRGPTRARPGRGRRAASRGRRAARAAPAPWHAAATPRRVSERRRRALRRARPAIARGERRSRLARRRRRSAAPAGALLPRAQHAATGLRVKGVGLAARLRLATRDDGVSELGARAGASLMDLAARLRLATRETGAELRALIGDSLAACVALSFVVACSGEPALTAPAVPVAKQAVVVIEPPRLRIGDVAAIEIVVVTPPGHRVLPVKPPPSVPGLWLLDAEALPPEVEGARQVQRTRIRVRAREAGSHEWPAQRVEIEDASGVSEELVAPARPFEVVSVLPSFPERTEPFAYRMPSAERDTVAPLWAAAAGSLATLAAIGSFLLVQRARRRTRARSLANAQLAAARPWTEALAALDAARAEPDWRRAGGIGARALRRYVARRFDLAVESLTSEEFAAVAQPFGVGSRWPAALECLRDFDAERFRAAGDANADAQVRAALASARQFVEASIPPEAHR